MTRVIFCIVLSSFASFAAIISTNAQSSPTKKVVVTENIPVAKPTPETVRPIIVVGQSTQTQAANAPPTEPKVVVPGQIATKPVERPRQTSTTHSFREIKAMIADAKRQMQTRPITIASSGSVYKGVEIVRVAFADETTGKVDFVTLEKTNFLVTGGDKLVVSNNGNPVLLRTIRGNGVNTPVTITATDGTMHLPLLVQYPRVTNGRYEETAYYVSTHPGLVTPEVVNAGRLYVHNIIEIARERLREKGIKIEPKLAEIAERLAAVEHVDHMRFRTEEHAKIYDDVYTLFALNEGDTYRYAISSAGAGGIVQMIPSTYRMVRSWHPNVPLIPDFVDGMRNHVNASQAMLLYMQRTWNDLSMSPAITEALTAGYASQKHLMAAGYNSNPARLSTYINRGGSNWETLIPRETKMYLQIYDSVERSVPISKHNQ